MALSCPSGATTLFYLVETLPGVCRVGTLAMCAKALRTATTAVPVQDPSGKFAMQQS